MIDVSRPLMDEDVFLLAGVVRFLDDSLYDHVVAVPHSDITLRVVHVQVFYGRRHYFLVQLVFPEHNHQENNHH